jgi:hypothetical protein
MIARVAGGRWGLAGCMMPGLRAEDGRLQQAPSGDPRLARDLCRYRSRSGGRLAADRNAQEILHLPSMKLHGLYDDV